MKISTIYGILFIFFLKQFSASANLVERQTEDNLFLQGPKLIDGIVGGFIGGVSAGYNFVKESLDQESKSPPDLIPDLAPPVSKGHVSPIPQQAEDPVYPLAVEATQEEDECDPSIQSAIDCQYQSYMIYPLYCAEPQNAAVTSLLTSWAVNYFISQNDLCGGILFWRAKRLTVDQVKTLRGMKTIVSSVVIDQFTIVEGITKSSKGIRKSSNARSSTGRLTRRSDSDTISKQSPAPDHLAFLSWSLWENSKPSDFYYLTNAGLHTSIYIIDLGVQPANAEFLTRSVVTRWLHAGSSDGREDDVNGHGSCILSAAAGIYCGPVKEMKAIIVKMGSTKVTQFGREKYKIDMSEFLDGLQRIINDLDARMQKEKIWGHTILNISFNFDSSDGIIIATLRGLLEILINDYHVVVTVSAGNIHSLSPLSFITGYPALLASSLPIIVVGGIDVINGREHHRSKIDDEVTILAPYSVVCASNEPGDSFRPEGSGTSFSSAIVAGVLGGMLSGKWGDITRKRIGHEQGFTMAAAAKEHLVNTGRDVQDSRFKAVANELRGEIGPPSWGRTF